MDWKLNENVDNLNDVNSDDGLKPKNYSTTFYNKKFCTKYSIFRHVQYMAKKYISFKYNIDS